MLLPGPNKSCPRNHLSLLSIYSDAEDSDPLVTFKLPRRQQGQWDSHREIGNEEYFKVSEVVSLQVVFLEKICIKRIGGERNDD